jgi:hypothetical protein
MIDVEATDRNRTITSKFNYDVQDEAIRKVKMECTINGKLTEDYYKDVIFCYNHVLLFGPTNAKQSCIIISWKICVLKIKFTVEPADKMTDNQKSLCEELF